MVIKESSIIYFWGILKKYNKVNFTGLYNNYHFSLLIALLLLLSPKIYHFTNIPYKFLLIPQ